MKIFIVLSLIAMSASSFAADIEAICLSSVAKEHMAIVTTMKFNLKDASAVRTEMDWNGKVISKKTLSLLDPARVLIDQEDKSIAYSMMDVDAEFYLCSENN